MSALQPDLSPDARDTLERLARAPTSPQRLAFRSRIVLAAADGIPIREIARRLGTTRPTVRLWLKRFSKLGSSGLETDAPGRGRPRSLTPEDQTAIVQVRLTQGINAPSAATVASQFGTSVSTIRRIWRSAHVLLHEG